jgi:type I restriction enzyme R subunit
MTSDTSELGLEALIVRDMTSKAGGWIGGTPSDYNREYCVDLKQLTAFLRASQPEVSEVLDLGDDTPTRRKFLSRLQGEITKRGTIDVLRHGIRHGAHDITLFYGTPSPGNEKAKQQYENNRFSITRQLRYSRDETQLALDLGTFINGLPIATFELKNNLTKQTVEDAVEQYKRDRDPREPLFQFGRCIAHFAVDDQSVRYCTHLTGRSSWFLPFDKGWHDGAGNPPNPDGIKTDYLWKDSLTPRGLTDILENYAQIVVEKNPKTGKKTSRQVFPRYHQLDLVRKLLADAREHGAGRRYLIQHSAGSGKSNSIAWLAHQLIGLEQITPRSSTRSLSSPTDAFSTHRSRTRLSSSLKSERRWAMPNARVIFASSLRVARRSSSRRSRNSLSSSRTSEASTEHVSSPY